MKTILLSFALLASLIVGAYAWAGYTRTMLVLDMRNAPELPKHFRMSTDSLPANINAKGLAELQIAGGAQFSKSAFYKLTSKINAKKIMVIDLRQESHGMLNGNAVSWYGVRNADNANKTMEEVEKDQSELLTELGDEEVATVNKVMQKNAEGEIKKIKATEYMVHQTSTEQELVTGLGHRYKRIYVQDFHAPSDKQVDRFITAINNVPPNKWIYFHCRAGIGRTTVFMTMYDMMKNAKQVSFDDIMTRQAALGGKDLRIMPPKNHFKYKASVERLEFLKQFYQYAHDNKDNFKTSWMAWVKKAK